MSLSSYWLYTVVKYKLQHITHAICSTKCHVGSGGQKATTRARVGVEMHPRLQLTLSEPEVPEIRSWKPMSPRSRGSQRIVHACDGLSLLFDEEEADTLCFSQRTRTCET